jgi:3-oxoacyl-[acyl-carrier-protein] synthase-3
MAIFSVPNVKISGISACVPKEVKFNKDYTWISEKERINLIKTIGVEKKHHSKKGTSASDLCYVAADGLIKELNWNREEIELLIFVSQSKDYLLPATSCILQERLKLPKTCVAQDVNMGCSGYNYGLSTITAMMSHGGFKKALLLTGDISSFGSYKDKTVYPLFGDAGTATALEFDENAEKMTFNLQTDGKGYKAIIIKDGGFRGLPTKKSFEYKKYAKGIIRNSGHLILDGIEVFNFSLREVAPNIKILLKHTEKNINDFDYIVFHQANILMNNTIKKMLKIDSEKFPSSIKDYGNTSSASIPLTIVTQLSNEVTTKKLSILIAGFGVGLSWGSNNLELNKITCPELFIYEDYKEKYGINKI